MTDADLYQPEVETDTNTDTETERGTEQPHAGRSGDPPEAVTDLPPSSKLVYKTLEWNGRLTQQEIIERSLLSARTVRDALSRLEDNDLVDRDVYYRDARQNVYALSDPAGRGD